MVKFDDLVKFVTKQARVASNPIYGNTKDTNLANKGRRGNHSSDRVHLLTATTTNDGQCCMYCSHKMHTLKCCTHWNVAKISKPIEDCLKFMREKGLCFGSVKAVWTATRSYLVKIVEDATLLFYIGRKKPCMIQNKQRLKPSNLLKQFPLALLV